MNGHVLHCIGEFLPVQETAKLLLINKQWHSAAMLEQRIFKAEWKHQIDMQKRGWPPEIADHTDMATLAIEVLGMQRNFLPHYIHHTWLPFDAVVWLKPHLYRYGRHRRHRGKPLW
jgi:hypothetical protein